MTGNKDNFEYTLCKAENSLSAEMSDDEKIDLAAQRILEKYRAAFIELAK